MKETVICAHCGKTLYRKPSLIKKSKTGLFFCSRKCQQAEQRIGGKLEIDFYGTASRKNTCRRCGKPIRNTNSGLCIECYYIQKIINTGMLTKGDLTNGLYTSGNRYQLIRSHANNCMKKLYKKKPVCKKCGYDLHVQVCHIKPISDFEDEALISEINAETNLIYLCPNHHWELDNGYLEL